MSEEGVIADVAWDGIRFEGELKVPSVGAGGGERLTIGKGESERRER